MIERETLIRWTNELVAFANGEEPLFTYRDADELPTEWHSPKRVKLLRDLVNRYLGELAEWQPSKSDVPASAVRHARQWLTAPIVRSTKGAGASLIPMDGAFSLDVEGQLQVAPRFRSLDAQYAITFAELVGSKPAVFIKRCHCKKFLVRLANARGQPKKLCREHYEKSVQTHRKNAK